MTRNECDTERCAVCAGTGAELIALPGNVVHQGPCFWCGGTGATEAPAAVCGVCGRVGVVVGDTRVCPDCTHWEDTDPRYLDDPRGDEGDDYGPFSDGGW